MAIIPICGALTIYLCILCRIFVFSLRLQINSKGRDHFLSIFADCAADCLTSMPDCQWFMTDLRPNGSRPRLGHLWVGELHHWHFCHPCIALDSSKLQQGSNLASFPTFALNSHYNRSSSHWPCVKSCLVGGRDKYWDRITSIFSYL